MPMLVFGSNANIQERDNHLCQDIKPFASWTSFFPRIFAKHKIKVTTSTPPLTPALRGSQAEALEADLQTLQRFVFARMED